MPLPFLEVLWALGPGSLVREDEFWSGYLRICPSHCWVFASSGFLPLTASRGAFLPFCPSFSFDLSGVEVTSQNITFPCPLFWEPPLLPSLSTVAATQITPGEKSALRPLCHATSGTASIPKACSESPGTAPAALQDTILRLIPKSEPQEDLQLFSDLHFTALITKLKRLSLSLYSAVPLCPKHSICLTMLGYPQTLSGPPSPIFPPSQPQGIWDSPRDFLCPKPKHGPKGLEPHSAIFLFWPPPSRFLFRMWAPLPATAGRPCGHRCSCVPANCGSGVFMCTPAQQAHPR